ncbi:MAG TPA: hypothetical protein VKS99_17510 [Blastocatellia bacterium]|nr:hypothetical protein [Blastocatellia bacterium]
MAKLIRSYQTENREIDKLNPRKDNEQPFMVSVSVKTDISDEGPRNNNHIALCCGKQIEDKAQTRRDSFLRASSANTLLNSSVLPQNRLVNS